MNKIKFTTTLIAMMALSYGILEIQSFLSENIINHNTPLKQALNDFLNGKINP